MQCLLIASNSSSYLVLFPLLRSFFPAFQFAMQARDSLSGILGGMLYLSTLDIGMSDEMEVSSRPHPGLQLTT